jgi:hypothetical protein
MTKSDILARYTVLKSKSPWQGAKQFELDTSGKIYTTSVPPFVTLKNHS